LVHLLVVSGSVITMTDSISETALEQIGGQVVVGAAAGVHQGSQGAALHCHAQEALAKAHGFVFRLNLVLLKVSEIDLMRGVVVCAVRRPLCLAQCDRPAGVGKAMARHGVGFHDAVTASITR
jgi:hypothetical protein